MKGYLYPSTQKLAVGERLPGDSEYKPENSGPNDINTLDQSSGHSGLQGPENPALYPEYPGLAGEKPLYCSLNGICDSQMFF